MIRRDTEDYLPRSGLLSPSLSGGYTYSPATGIVPTQQPAPMTLAQYLEKARAEFVPQMISTNVPWNADSGDDNQWTMSSFNEADAAKKYAQERASQNSALTPEKISAINALANSQYGAADTLAKKIGYTGSIFSATPEGYSTDYQGGMDVSTPNYGVNPDFQDALSKYGITPADVSGNPGYNIADANGNVISTERTGDGKSFFWDTLAPAAIAGGAAFFGVPAIGGALGGGLLGGAAAGAGLGGATAAAQGNDVGKGLLMGGIGGGISGYMGGVPDTTAAQSAIPPSSVAGVPDEVRQAIDAYAQSPMPDVMQGLPDFGAAQSFPVAAQPAAQWQPLQQAPSWVDSVPSEVESSLQQAATQTPEQVQSLIPSWQMPTVAPQEFRPSVDSQQYSTDAGITGADAAKAATAPKTVNLPGNGGTMATSGGIQGAADLAAQTLRDATASPDIGGGLLSQAGGFGADVINKVGGAAGAAGSWAAQNPMLAKLLLGGAGALLSSQGGNSAAPRAPIVPVQWKSPVQGIPQGLLSGVQSGGQSSQYPAAMGLLGGQPNSGAWRFLGK